MRRFKVTFELQLYGETPGTAFGRALGLMEVAIARMRQRRVAEVIDQVPAMPVGALDGASHSADEPDGWRLFYSVDDD